MRVAALRIFVFSKSIKTGPTRACDAPAPAPAPAAVAPAWFYSALLSPPGLSPCDGPPARCCFAAVLEIAPASSPFAHRTWSRMTPIAGIAVVIDTTGLIRAPRNGNANSRRHPLPHV